MANVKLPIDDPVAAVNTPAVKVPVVVKFSSPNEIAPPLSVIEPSTNVKVPILDPDAAVMVPLLIVKVPLVIVKLPPELKLIFSVAASEAPVLKDNLVALLSVVNSASATASIPAHTSMASVPSLSLGASN